MLIKKFFFIYFQCDFLKNVKIKFNSIISRLQNVVVFGSFDFFCTCLGLFLTITTMTFQLDITFGFTYFVLAM
jgi:hypothetical protein